MTELLKAQSGALPFAPATPISEPFWNACQRGELAYQRCHGCQAATFPAAQHCRNCLDPRLEWTTSVGEGRLYTWTVVRRPVTPAFVTPYAPAIVDVAEGFQMLSSVVDVSPDGLHSGMALTVRFHEDANGRKLPYFGPR